MKRIKPVRSTSDSGYPSAEESGVNRRGFMQVIMASGAAVAGGLIIGGEVAHARGAVARPSYRVTITLTPPVTFKGCSSAIVSIIASTWDYNVQSFLMKKSERAGVVAAIRRALLKHQCADLKGSKKYQMGQAVATAVKKRYLKRTGKSGARTWVQLVIKPKK